MVELGVNKGYMKTFMVEELCEFKHGLDVALNWIRNAQSMRLMVCYFYGTHSSILVVSYSDIDSGIYISRIAKGISCPTSSIDDCCIFMYR